MKCPHCTVEIHEGFENSPLFSSKNNALASVGKDANGQGQYWSVSHMTCPACAGPIMRLHRMHLGKGGLGMVPDKGRLIEPKGAGRPRASAEVPAELAEDYNEACLVLEDSPKASAALSRRCLQGLLRAQGFTQHDLAKAIDAVLASGKLPSGLAHNVDAIRNIGNFAAHPMKDTNSGAILPVEPHEAEWNLDVLEGLFDYYYVQPARDAARKAALNQKLQSAGKPPLKQ